jgi:nitrogen fixation NifU-like protein
MASFAEHLAHPRGMKRLAAPSGVGRAQVEGDSVHLEISIRVHDGRIVETSFESFLCGFAIGLCSLLTERIEGLSLQEAAQISREDLLAECSGLSEAKQSYAQTAICALRSALTQAVTISEATDSKSRVL